MSKIEKLPAPPAPDRSRAFEIMTYVPPGHTVCLVDGQQHWPHLRQGEIAIVDTRDRELVWGEVYLVHQSHGPKIWQVRRPPAEVPAPPCAMLCPLNGPRWLPNGDIDLQGPLHMSDGPIHLDALMARLLGRVVGVLEEAPYIPAAAAGRAAR